MKKLVFWFVAFAAVSFASCGNKAANNGAENADSTTVETVETAVVETVETVDTVAAVDSTAADSAAVAE